MKYTALSKVVLRLILEADCSDQFDEFKDASGDDGDDDGNVFDEIYFQFYRAAIIFMMMMMMMMSLKI